MDYEDLTTYCLQIGSNYLNLEGKTPIITSSSLRNKNGTTWRETPYKYQSFKVEPIEPNGGKIHKDIILSKWNR